MAPNASALLLANSDQIYIALLKFDFFFFLGFSVQFVAVVVTYNDPEFGLTVAAIPITIVFLLLAALWARRENVFGMFIVIVRLLDPFFQNCWWQS